MPSMSKDAWGAGSFSTKCSRFSTSFRVKFSIGLRSSTTRSGREQMGTPSICMWQRRLQRHSYRDQQKGERLWVAQLALYLEAALHI